jgi:hypothetical protein
MATLFELSKTLEYLEQAILESENNTDADALLLQYLNTESDLTQKLDAYCTLIKEVEARSEARFKESKRLQDLAEADLNLVKRLKDRLLWYMHDKDISRVNTTRFNLSRVKNGGKLPVILDEAINVEGLPKRFVRVSVDVNRTAVREALESGEDLPFARLGSRGDRVQIK